MPFSMRTLEDRCIMTRTAPDEGEDTVLATIIGVQDTLCDSEILRCLPMFCLFVAARRVARAGHDERSQAVVVTQHGGTQL